LYVKLHDAVVSTLAFPVLVRISVQSSWLATVEAEQLVTDACTRAVEVKVPNRPKTKPAIAIAAMRVMAIRITVASTGLIALRFRCRVILILVSSYEEAVAEKRAFPPLARIMDPVTCTPAPAAGDARAFPHEAVVSDPPDGTLPPLAMTPV